MALIKCPACGHMISERARRCPRCGTHFNRQSAPLAGGGYNKPKYDGGSKSGYQNNSMMLPVGAMLDRRYRVERYLASGGFGNTYVALDTRFNSRVAVKEFFMRGTNHRAPDQSSVLVSNPDNREGFEAQLDKFRREAQRIFNMRNEHIVHVIDLFDANGTSYYVMEFIEGESLSACVKRAPLNEIQVRRVAEQLLDALKAVHDAGFYHLDVKPGNIMVDRRDHCTLIDFGASKQMSMSERTSISSSGMAYTPGYAPIEQESQRTKHIGAWTDLYAVGATLYNLLTGECPPEIDPDDTDEGSRMFAYPYGVSVQLQRAISQLMNPSPRKRPQSVDAAKVLFDEPYQLPAGIISAPIMASNYPEPPIKPEPVQEVILEAKPAPVPAIQLMVESDPEQVPEAIQKHELESSPVPEPSDVPVPEPQEEKPLSEPVPEPQSMVPSEPETPEHQDEVPLVTPVSDSHDEVFDELVSEEDDNDSTLNHNKRWIALVAVVLLVIAIMVVPRLFSGKESTPTQTNTEKPMVNNPQRDTMHIAGSEKAGQTQQKKPEEKQTTASAVSVQVSTNPSPAAPPKTTPNSSQNQNKKVNAKSSSPTTVGEKQPDEKKSTEKKQVDQNKVDNLFNNKVDNKKVDNLFK